MFRIMCAAALATLMTTGDAAAQAACYSDDLQCRVTQLEARVAELEQRATRRAARGVSMAVNRPCGIYACETIAQDACASAGFARGVAVEIDREDAYGGRVTRVECFD